jgi:hypothetical protein
MDNPEFTSGADKGQIDRRRAGVIRDFEDDLDRAGDDLEFEIGKVISYAIEDVAGDDPRDPLCVTDETERSVRRVIQEHGWTARRVLRAFFQAIAP